MKSGTKKSDVQLYEVKFLDLRRLVDLLKTVRALVELPRHTLSLTIKTPSEDIWTATWMKSAPF